jgi:hypothetical protein
MTDRAWLVAPISGLAAQAFRLLLEPTLAAALERWQRGGLSPAGAAEIRAAFAVLVVAADEHLGRRACADASAQVVVAQVPAGSAEISTAAAADMLGVSPQRVRQLLAAGVLDGRRVGSVWMIARESVAGYGLARGEAA